MSGLLRATASTRAHLEKALLDCAPPTETITAGVDGATWCTYGEGTGGFTPIVPADSTGEPLTPPQTAYTPIPQPPVPQGLVRHATVGQLVP